MTYLYANRQRSRGNRPLCVSVTVGPVVLGFKSCCSGDARLRVQEDLYQDYVKKIAASCLCIMTVFDLYCYSFMAVLFPLVYNVMIILHWCPQLKCTLVKRLQHAPPESCMTLQVNSRISTGFA